MINSNLALAALLIASPPSPTANAEPSVDLPPSGPTEGPAEAPLTPRQEQLVRIIDERPPPLGPVGIGGWVLIGGGFALATGTLLATARIGEQPVFAGPDGALARREGGTIIWPSFVPLMGLSLASSAIGIAMLAVDLTALDRRRETRAIRLHFDLSPTQAGVHLRGRF